MSTRTARDAKSALPRSIVALVMLCVVCAPGCTRQGRETSKVREEQTGVTEVRAELEAQEGEKCHGRLRFPMQDGEFEQEVGVVSRLRPGAAEVAFSLARTKLVDRVCAQRNPSCRGVERYVRTWKSIEEREHVCAFALLDLKDLARFEARPLEELAQRQETFEAGIAAGIEALDAALVDGEQIFMEPIDVECVDGGYVADWLSDQLAAAAARGGITITKAHAPGPPVDIPRLDVRVRALDTLGPSTPEPGFEATLRLKREDGTQTLHVFSFSRAIAPRTPRMSSACTPLQLANSAELAISWSDTLRGGALCEHQRSRLFVRASKEGMARVIALTPDNKHGIVYFPENPKTPTVIPPKQDVDLVGEPSFIFKIEDGQDMETHVFALAPNAAAFGPLLGKIDRACRLRAEQIEAIRGDTFFTSPEVETTSRTFRILSGAQCAHLDTTSNRELAARARTVVSRLPYCDELE